MTCYSCHIEIEKDLNLGCFNYCSVVEILKAKISGLHKMTFLFNGTKKEVMLPALCGMPFRLEMKEVPLCFEACFEITDPNGAKYSFEKTECDGEVKSYCSFKIESIKTKINDPIIEDKIDTFAKECGRKPFIDKI